jgi:hypothetical protein
MPAVPVFVPGSPAALGTHDAFGHSDYSAAIGAILADAPVPFTLGLFGDWGVGKTSIIQAIGSKLTEQDIAFVSFDVWRYEGDALRRQFERRDLAETVLEAEASEGATTTRVELLVAGRAPVRGRSGIAKKAFDERIKRLRTSGDASDQDVITQYDERQTV